MPVRKVILAAIAAILAVCANSAVLAQPDAVLTPAGYGALRVGMTWAQARRAVPGLRQGELFGSCHEAYTPRMPGMSAMFNGGRLVRVSVGSPSRIATTRGIRVGDTAERVRAAYRGQFREEPHHYQGPQGRYFTIWSVRNRSGIRIETDEHRRVQVIHGGGPAIEYVEGCV
jgi:hypothetical protein